MSDFEDKILTFAFAFMLITLGLFMCIGIYYTIQEETIKIEQLKENPEKALYKNINFELNQGNKNEKIQNLDIQ